MRRTEHVETFERCLEDVVGVEVEERIGGDQFAGGGVDLLRATARNADANRGRSARTASRAAVGIDVLDREGTAALIDGVGLLIADREDGVTATIIEIGAQRYVCAQRVAVALFRDLVREIRFQTRKIGLGDEVDNTRNGVGAIGRRCTTGQNVNALHQSERNVVEIEAAVQFGRNQARTVEQDDVTVRTHAAQIDERRAAIAIVDGRTDAGNDTRNFTQNFFGGVVLLQFDGVSAGRRDRAGAFQVRIADQRTGNDDGVARFCTSSLRRFLCECGGCDQRRAQDRRCGAGTQKCPL